jgi:1,4-alpha-glucan branching enzyme
MPGDDWQKFANLRAMLGYMYTQPAKKLLFQGAEIGQWDEWSHERSVDWHLLEYEPHQGIQKWVGDLNRAYRNEPALHELDLDPAGFEWIDCSDAEGSVIAFFRRARNSPDLILVVCNFTPVPRSGYRVGVPRGGSWREILNSDSTAYGGSGWGNLGGLGAIQEPMHGRDWSLNLVLPPLSSSVFKSDHQDK